MAGASFVRTTTEPRMSACEDTVPCMNPPLKVHEVVESRLGLRMRETGTPPHVDCSVIHGKCE